MYDGAMHDLGSFGGADAFAAAISESGQVTGYATTADGVRHAFLYRDGQLKQLSVPGSASAGWAINGGGQVAGDYQNGDYVQPASTRRAAAPSRSVRSAAPKRWSTA